MWTLCLNHQLADRTHETSQRAAGCWQTECRPMRLDVAGTNVEVYGTVGEWERDHRTGRYVPCEDKSYKARVSSNPHQHSLMTFNSRKYQLRVASSNLPIVVAWQQTRSRQAEVRYRARELVLATMHLHARTSGRWLTEDQLRVTVDDEWSARVSTTVPSTKHILWSATDPVLSRVITALFATPAGYDQQSIIKEALVWLDLHILYCEKSLSESVLQFNDNRTRMHDIETRMGGGDAIEEQLQRQRLSLEWEGRGMMLSRELACARHAVLQLRVCFDRKCVPKRSELPPGLVVPLPRWVEIESNLPRWIDDVIRRHLVRQVPVRN